MTRLPLPIAWNVTLLAILSAGCLSSADSDDYEVILDDAGPEAGSTVADSGDAGSGPAPVGESTSESTPGESSAEDRSAASDSPVTAASDGSPAGSPSGSAGSPSKPESSGVSTTASPEAGADASNHSDSTSATSPVKQGTDAAEEPDATSPADNAGKPSDDKRSGQTSDSTDGTSDSTEQPATAQTRQTQKSGQKQEPAGSDKTADDQQGEGADGSADNGKESDASGSSSDPDNSKGDNSKDDSSTDDSQADKSSKKDTKSGQKTSPPREVKVLIPENEFRKEGPEGALRVSFDDLDLLKVLNMKPVTEDAPKLMPKWLKDLDGKRIRIRGFMYPPFEETGIRAFTLARDNQICCFGRNPLVYDLVDVFLREGTTTDYIQNRPFDVVGVFHIGDSIVPGQLYSIDDAIVIEK